MTRLSPPNPGEAGPYARASLVGSAYAAIQHMASVTQSPPGPDLGTSIYKRAGHLFRLALDPIGAVDARFARYGDIYRVGQSSNSLYVLKHPDYVRDVLVTHAHAFGKQHGAFQRLALVLGDGLLTSEGERWRRQRRLVQPAFARPRLCEYSETMVEEALRTAGELRDRARLSLSAVMTQLTLRIVARTLFGQHLLDTSRVARAMRWLNAAFGRPDLMPRGLPTPTRLRVRRGVADLDAAVFGMIDRRIASSAQGAVREHDLLQRLLDARDEEGDLRGLDRRELRDQLLTLYLAGHETTSHALTWAFYLLSQHPAAQRALDDELARVLGGRPPGFEDLQNLVYTEWVVKEAMRLYPPAFAIPRLAIQDAAIGPYPISAGSEVVIWTYHMHRDPRFFPEPERFLPERFADSSSAERSKHAYLPFGAGQRACIGQTFAMIEAQLLIASLAQQVRFRYDGKRPPRPRTGVTLAPDNGLPIRVERLR
jgi:cytochrome P450